jgi:UDP-2-acetamido-3-amino-2,3-dideoxy-glucuronate N-acetyltransferase
VRGVRVSRHAPASGYNPGVNDFFVHPSAVVDPGAEVGDRTRVWHFCHVSAGAVIGADCSLGQNVFVAPGVRIGDGVKVQNNVALYAGVVLEDFVFCGPSMVFTNVRVPRAAYPERPERYEPTRVRHGASIGANATIVCGVTVGRWALIGAGAVVTRDVPDFGLVMGVPGRHAGFVCQCGERLCFADGHAACARCARRYERDARGQVSAAPEAP